MWRLIRRYSIILLACLFYTSPTLARPIFQETVVLTDLINQYRSQNGLFVLQNNAALTTVAQNQAETMAANGSVSHLDGLGNRVDVRASQVGYNGRVTELIFGTSGGASRALEWWQGSELHRSLLLSSRYVEIGVGAAFNANDGWTYWVVVLGDGTGVGGVENASGAVSSQTSGIESGPTVTPIDPAVLLLPTATTAPLPTQAAIPTITPLPTAIPLIVATAVPEVVATVPVSVTAVAELPSWPTVATGELVLTPEIRLDTLLTQTETSSPSTADTTANRPDDRIAPVLDPSANQERPQPNWLIVVFALLSILFSPLLFYFGWVVTD